MKRLLKDTDLAEILGICRSSVWNMSRDGRLPAPLRIGLVTRWRQDEVEAAIEAMPRLAPGDAAEAAGRRRAASRLAKRAAAS